MNKIMSLYKEVGEHIQTGTEAKIQKDFVMGRNQNYEARIKSLNHDVRELKIRVQKLESNSDSSGEQYKRQVLPK